MALLELFKEQLENESQAIAKDRNLTKRGDHLIWWYFLKLVELKPEDIEEVYCDGFNDYGIDAIRVDDSDNTVHFYSFKNPVNIADAFPSGDVDKLIQGLTLLIRRDLDAVKANEALRKRADELRQLVPTAYRIHLVTSGTGIAGDVATKLNGFISDLKTPSDDFCTWESEDIQALQTRFYTHTLPTVEEPLVIDLDYPPYQVRAADHDSYMFAMLGKDLAAVFGKHGEALLQQNIRVSQGDRATNAQIRDTATGAEAGNFLHYNNGVVFLAESAHHDAFTKKLILKRFQVVNGGQTIRVLWHALAAGALKAGLLVPVRVITAGEDKDFANNQNRIEASFLRSNDPQVVQLASALASQGWHLERREGEVRALTERDRASIEARLGASLGARTIPLTAGMQAYVATYMRQPELAKRYPKRIFIGVKDGGSFERVFARDLTAEKVIAAHRLMTATGDYVKQFGNCKRRKERGNADWSSAYTSLLGRELVDKHITSLDQVIPPSTVFLSAIVFDAWVNVHGRPVQELVDLLEGLDSTLLNQMIGELIDVRHQLGGESRSWPTLLKSQTLYEEFAKHLRREKPAPAG
jgi:hypothetical protein